MSTTTKVTSGPCPRCSGLTELTALCGECGEWSTREEFEERGGCCSGRAVYLYNVWPGEGCYPGDGFGDVQWICIDLCSLASSATPLAEVVAAPTTPGEWAAAYAAGGAQVLPLHTPAGDKCDCRSRTCEHPGKHPRTMHGKDDATTEPDTVSRWWGMWPTANIGIRPAPGHVVLDVDPRNGGDIQLAAMQERYGALPATRTAATGSGGSHIWFELSGDLVGELAPGIDVKTASGYLVAPPSVHASGGVYSWVNDGPIVPAPTYLAELLRRPPRPVRSTGTGATVTAAVVEGLVRTVRTAPTGKRNNLLYWACLRASEKGIDLEPLIDAAVENGIARRAAEKTADSAARSADVPEVESSR